MSALLAKAPEGRFAETPDNSHYYVGCDAWLSDDTVRVTVAGHTDEAPSHDFEHLLNFDLKMRKFTRVSDKITP